MSKLTRNKASSPEIIVQTQGAWGLITLNRPEVINALSLTMMEKLEATLQAWAADDRIKAVIIRGEGPRGFCAGGDLKGVYQLMEQADAATLEHLFRTEYTFTIRLQEFPKPYIAFMHGICMGGGLGASVHGSFRIVSPEAVLAMPEVAIGYFPDVGAASFLNKCPGQIGRYLALTGKSVSAGDAFYAGLVTHYVDKQEHPQIFRQMLLEPNPSLQSVSNILKNYSITPSQSFLETHQEEIDQYFGENNLQDIFTALKRCTSVFAHETLELLKSRSPASMRITFELLERTKQLDFRQQMNLEFFLSQKFVSGSDFREGIRAAVIDKDRSPHWQYSEISEFPQDTVAEYFSGPTHDYLRN